MRHSIVRSSRGLFLLAAVLLSFLMAPAALARDHHSHWGVSLGFSGPGYSIGYSDCRHCGGGYWSGSFYGGGYYGGGYGGGYYGGYYSPSYYPSYGSYSYSPSYYDYGYYPSYGRVYHRTTVRPVVRRVVHTRRYVDDDYYDNDGYVSERRYEDEHYRNRGQYYERDRRYSSRAAYYDHD